MNVAKTHFFVGETMVMNLALRNKGSEPYAIPSVRNMLGEDAFTIYDTAAKAVCRPWTQILQFSPDNVLLEAGDTMRLGCPFYSHYLVGNRAANEFIFDNRDENGFFADTLLQEGDYHVRLTLAGGLPNVRTTTLDKTFSIVRGEGYRIRIVNEAFFDEMEWPRPLVRAVLVGEPSFAHPVWEGGVFFEQDDLPAEFIREGAELEVYLACKGYIMGHAIPGPANQVLGMRCKVMKK